MGNFSLISLKRKRKRYKNGYLRADLKFLKKNMGEETLCITALVKDGNLIIYNVGGCCSVIRFSGAAEVHWSDRASELLNYIYFFLFFLKILSQQRFREPLVDYNFATTSGETLTYLTAIQTLTNLAAQLHKLTNELLLRSKHPV
ncbi:hypothetical protein KSP40_PGU022303 [Platanthera guangdongensis]|uniref:Uncharacterized protein n=1 Tax=Platanthera guangdongensis TaxID=2320717 RepID=A0ABR2MT08_9ASPA